MKIFQYLTTLIVSATALLNTSCIESADYYIKELIYLNYQLESAKAVGDRDVAAELEDRIEKLEQEINLRSQADKEFREEYADALTKAVEEGSLCEDTAR